MGGLDRLVPEELRCADIDTRFRSRLLILILLIALFAATAVLVITLLTGSFMEAGLAVLRLALLGGILALLRRTRSVALAVHLLAGISWLRWTALAIRVEAVVPLMMLAALPMAVLFLSGRRGAYVWFGVVLATLLYVTLGLDIGAPLAPDKRALALAAPLLFCTAVFALSWAHDGLARRAISEVARATAHALESERRALQAENERSQAQARARLVESSRLAALGTLSAGVAHEINNPLAVVMANVQYLDEELSHLAPGLAPARRRELDEILFDTQESLERIRRIVRDLGAFSQVDRESAAQPIDVAEVLGSALNLVRMEFHQRARVITDFGRVPGVRGRASDLAQVFVNLLLNAAQAIPEGAPERNEVRISVELDERGQVLTAVRDTGAGIPNDDLPRVFEPFFTTKPQGEGTGLGLSVCHGIVTQMGGTITLDSEPGRGAIARVALPAFAGAGQDDRPDPGAPVAPPAWRAVAAPAPGSGTRPRPGRVLVVEDEPAVARALAHLLAGHEVEIAIGGREAMRLLDRDAGFDAVLCDLMMPGVTGMDLHQHVARCHPALAERFAFMSGGTFTERARRFVAESRQPCLEKPLSQEALDEALRALLGDADVQASA